jgi:hypothetical protein
MGTTISRPGDLVGRQTVSNVSADARNGLAPTRMGAAIGMPGDAVSGQNGAGVRNGLAPTRMGAAIAMPGDINRSDLPGTPMYRQQAVKRSRQQPVKRVQPTYTEVRPASYGDYNLTSDKRNY